jgi:hypothetical protein
MEAICSYELLIHLQDYMTSQPEIPQFNFIYCLNKNIFSDMKECKKLVNFQVQDLQQQ